MAEYVYLPLEDASKSIGAKVNLFAVVTEVGAPKRSRGTDYVITLKIVDQSYPLSGLSVNFFAENTTMLPHVKSTGDVISLHRVMMKLHNGDFYCVFNKRFSSFALYEGKTAVSFSPYQYSMKYHATDHDKKLLLQLRQWMLNYHSHAGLEQLRGIKIDKVFDLICKVLHVSEMSEGKYMLFVWDGTDTPPVSFQSDLNAEGDNPSPLHPEAFSLSREVLCTFPCVGTVLRVTMDKFSKELSWLQGGNHWVKLCSIKFELESGMWKGLLQHGSRVRLLSVEDENVVFCERNFTERSQCKLQRQPLTSFPRPSHITETDYENVAYATLMESLTHKEVTHKFKTVVRVLAAYPWQAEQFCSLVRGHYRIRLTLEDPTARIHAYIFEEDGVKFFGGCPSPDELASKMNMLLGISGDAGREGHACRDPPWVWCCLKSYYLDKRDPWGSRKYRIFGTILVG